MLLLAGTSVRMLAEAAQRDGLAAVAADVFGDADTRRAAARWVDIGSAGSLAIDEPRFVASLQSEGLSGWVAGSGFEGRPDLLERGAARLPLLGCDADTVRRVRDPASFFACLDVHGIAYPEWRARAPADAAGWLVKHPGGSGGWQVRRAGALQGDAAGSGHYAQRESAGRPMSATFVANGRSASVLGFNELMVGPLGARPYVFRGAIGPLRLPGDIERRVEHAVDAVTAGFRLRGLASLDFLLDDSRIDVLEVNPRPPATIALYADRRPLTLHLRACRDGTLPARRVPEPGPPRGFEIVHAPRPLRLSAAAARCMAASPCCHDLPAAHAVFGAGDPICTLSASGADAAQVRHRLAAGRDSLLPTLEIWT